MTDKHILISHKSGKNYFVEDPKNDYHCSEGIIKSIDLQNSKTTTISSKNVKFSKINPTLPDLKNEFARGPQIICEKDAGYIIAKTGINQNSLCVDAGAGTGAMTLTLANICKKVTCYDINKKHIKVVEKNVKLVDALNVVVKQGNIATDLSENDLDLITLDLPEPQLAFLKVEEALKLGGWLVVYLPNIVQMKVCLDALCTYKSLKLIELTEINKRDWKVDKEILRPIHSQVVHTGFLAFIRKL